MASFAADEVLGPISPELVLVSPPELAERARAVLPETPLYPPRPVPAMQPVRGLLAFWAVCLCGTLLPLALSLVVGRR